MTNQAYLAQVFSSIQGEGLFTGLRQAFIRFSQCNLKCAYCDSKNSQRLLPHFLHEIVPGSGNFKKENNPVTVKQLIQLLHPFISDKCQIHSIALTGGEPLLQANFIHELCAAMNQVNFYLETNGVLPEELLKVVDEIDFISMDYKLPGSSGGQDFSQEHLEFLKIGRHRMTQVKIVVTRKTTDHEFMKAVGIIALVEPKIPLIIQPENTRGRLRLAPNWKQLFRLQELACRDLMNVRVMPQAHKAMGMI